MATFIWTLQGTSPTVIDLTDIIQFAGAAFGNALFVGNYNDSTHVKTAAGANKSSGNTPHNTKRINSTHYSLDGGASTLLDASHPATGECPLKINFSHGSSVVTTDHILYAYDAANTLNGPVDVDFYCAEQGDSTWTQANGSASALTVTDDTAATSHDFFFLISCSPTAVGLKSLFVIRDELIYS